MKDRDGKSRGFGFVDFESPEDAKNALENLNGSDLGNISSFHIILRLFPCTLFLFLFLFLLHDIMCQDRNLYTLDMLRKEVSVINC